MTPPRTFRVLVLCSMLSSMAIVIAWAGVVGWRMWPEWRTVREMKRAVEANEPGRFLDAVEAVDRLGVAEAAVDEIAPLCHHAEPRVRMYAVMARTVLGPRGPSEARELIARFDDPDEDINVRRATLPCLVLFREAAGKAVPSLSRAIRDDNHPLHGSAVTAFIQLGWEVTGALPLQGYVSWLYQEPPKPDATRREMGAFLAREADQTAYVLAMLDRQRSKTGVP